MKKFKKGQRVLVEAVIDVDERSYVSKNAERVYFVNTFCGNSHLTMVTEDKIRPMTEKVKIPQFVAEWIDLYQRQGYTLFDAMDNPTPNEDVGEYLADNLDIFARAWLDGYEVEQEKLYEVVLPGTSNYYDQPQKLCQAEEGNYFFCGEASKFKHSFTEDEIRNEFAWAWDAGFAKEVADDTKF